MSAMTPLTIHLIPHTHWDREWYLPLGGFRARLARAVDGLLELLTRDDRIPAFHLDGQTVLLEDYLALRPERRDEVAQLLAAGRLTSGPWYVLADEQVPTGEALLRNLELGRRDLGRLGASSPRRPEGGPGVWYSPDAFGHPGVVPALAAEFGLETAVVWRGLHPDSLGGKDLGWWVAPGGRRVLVYHLPADGYEIGNNLLVPDAELGGAWQRVAEAVLPRAATSQVAVLVGADHHAADPALGALAERLGRVSPGQRFRLSSLAEFFDAVRAEAHGLPELRGELRWSYGYAWTLQGAHGTRAPLKRRTAVVELALARQAEPLAALSGLRGEAETLEGAWREVVQCHFHDTISGTTHDAVARAAANRLTDAEAIAAEVTRASLHAIIGHDPDAARSGHATRPTLVLWNPTARPRGGVVTAEITCFRGDVPVGPPSGRPPRKGVGFRPFALLVGGVTVAPQVLSVERGLERVDAARHYPDQDAVDRVRCAFPLPAKLPGLGLAAVELTERAEEPPEPFAAAGRAAIGNGRIHGAVAPDGTIQLFHPATGLRFDDLARLESEADEGDTYSFAPARGDRPALPRGRVRPKITADGPLVSAMEWEVRLARPSGKVRAAWRLEASGDRPFLSAALTLDNQATDHRLRLRFPTGLRRVAAVAGAQFGSVARMPMGRRPTVRGGLREAPVPTAPGHRWVAAARKEVGLAVLMPGFFEYEWTAAGDLLITLLRSVGELSKSDLSTRPGHAGWPTPTPEAQCLGQEEVRLALAFVTEWELTRPDELEALWEDAFLPPLASWVRDCTATGVGTPVGAELEGEGLVFSACHPAPDGDGLILRCYNARDEATRGRWRLARRPARASRVWADGMVSSGPASTCEGHDIAFDVAPHELVSFHVTFA